ncbi:hypothetical protein [Cytobacillus horneckiae]|uniref:hypothetical protein n=1 Tax=Cytobacillus horneckiae TaxID=549687 RepID=UPI003D9A749C
MKNTFKLFFMSTLLLMLLVACGTNQNADEDSSNRDDNEANQPDEKNPKDDESSENNKIRLMEQNIKFEKNGETEEETAFLKESDNQDFSMYVLPNFVLTGEEPNKDVLHLEEQSNIFMRIELIPDDADMKMLEENTKIQLQSVNEEVTSPSLPNDSFFEDAIMMEASADGDTVTSFLIKNEQANVKLTIFTDKSEHDFKDAFIQMAKTIENK